MSQQLIFSVVGINAELQLTAVEWKQSLGQVPSDRCDKSGGVQAAAKCVLKIYRTTFFIMTGCIEWLVGRELRSGYIPF